MHEFYGDDTSPFSFLWPTFHRWPVRALVLFSQIGKNWIDVLR